MGGSTKLLRFRDPLAIRNKAGLALLEIRVRADRVTFRVRFYGDLSRATLPTMTAQWLIGTEGFVDKGATWVETPRGWRLPASGG
jgi:hypothetical protein